jgi:hypothetical protein
MNKFFTLIAFISITITATAQLCPGGGTSFSNAVLFDPTWISGCSTGTSCTGGTIFDNRAACEPTTAIDPCAPSPTCGTLSSMGSDLWFKFYATGTTAAIVVNQSVSFVASVQALSGGPTCGVLTQIGCVIAGGPSSGVTLNLTGLTAGNLYYFRVFGTSTPVSQRTGTFCFCGSAGLSNITLPVKLLSFNASIERNTANIKWTTAAETNFSRFDIEKSINGKDFSIIGSKLADNSGTSQNDYFFEDKTPMAANNYYRLKIMDADGRYEFSPIVKVSTTNSHKFTATADNQNHRIIINADRDCQVEVYSITGAKFATISVKKGNNSLYSDLTSGIYLIRRSDTGDTQKIAIF